METGVLWAGQTVLAENFPEKRGGRGVNGGWVRHGPGHLQKGSPSWMPGTGTKQDV